MADYMKAGIEVTYMEWDDDKQDYVPKEAFFCPGFNWTGSDDNIQPELFEVIRTVVSSICSDNRDRFKEWFENKGPSPEEKARLDKLATEIGQMPEWKVRQLLGEN